MAQKAVFDHRKTRRLMRILGISRPYAVGLLESLWHVTMTHAPNGAIGRLTNDDIADEIRDPEWTADELVQAFIDSGWIDESAEHRLAIHDWSDHADGYIQAKLYRAGESFADGAKPSSRKLSAKERAAIESRQQSAADGGSRQQKGAETGRTAAEGGSLLHSAANGSTAAAAAAARQRLGSGGGSARNARQPTAAELAPPPPNEQPAAALAEELAGEIEQHQDCHSHGSTTRRKHLADRIDKSGEAWVRRAVELALQEPKIASALARFEDGCKPGESGQDRLSKAMEGEPDPRAKSAWLKANTNHLISETLGSIGEDAVPQPWKLVFRQVKAEHGEKTAYLCALGLSKSDQIKQLFNDPDQLTTAKLIELKGDLDERHAS